MAVKASAVTVGTSATRLDIQADSDARPDQMVMLSNTSATTTVYLGGPDVTMATGYPVAPSSSSPVIPLAAASELWGVVAATTASVRVLQIGV